MSVAFLKPEEAVQLLRIHEALLVDVRPAWSYAQEHVPYALSLPWGAHDHVPWMAAQAPVVWVLMSGSHRTALKAAKAMIACMPAHPERRVFVLEGGLRAWRQAGLPVLSAPSNLFMRLCSQFLGA